jgi:hypothetical protein
MPNWDWERRRSYLLAEKLKKAVMVVAGFIEQYGDDYGPNKYHSLRNALMQGTGLDFAPQAQGYINVFRNYKRLYASLELFTMENNKLYLLPIGEWISEYDPSSEEIYDLIIQSFSYPNPAFASYVEWVASGRTLTPMRLIMRCLSALSIAAPEVAYLTPTEIAHVLYEADDSLEDSVLANAISSSRRGLQPPAELPMYHPNEDEKRQVREILSFMLEAGVLRCNTSRIRDDSQFVLSTDVIHRRRTGTTQGNRHRVQNRIPGIDRTEFVEGAIYQENRRSRRRNNALREYALARYGLVCACCEVDYSKYGDIGNAAVDVHHLNPIAERTGNEITRIEDVRILCATCHRMIHAGGILRTPNELRQIIEQVRNQM